MLLDGAWEFELDLSNSGEERGLAKAEHLQSTICVPFCPDVSIPVEDGVRLETDLDHCKGCGICAAVCSFKAISMKEGL